MSQALTVVLSAGVGGVLGIFTTAWKSRKDLESQYDIDLRKSRIEAYEALWKELEPLAYHSPPGTVTPRVVRNLGGALRHWYFTTGGLFLSETTRQPYFNLQQGVSGALKHKAADSSEEIPDETLKALKTLASRLRTSCTDDVATRVRPRLGASVAERLARWWHWRSPVSVQVDRRWGWSPDGPVPYYFVIVKNVSNRIVTVKSISVDHAKRPRFEGGAKLTPFVLRPSEPLEVNARISAPDPDGVPRVAPGVKVTIDGRHKPIEKTTRHPVPIPGRSLLPPTS